MIVKVEKTEQPQTFQSEGCKVIPFAQNPEFRMEKTDGNPEAEALIYDLWLQASYPLDEDSEIPQTEQRA